MRITASERAMLERHYEEGDSVADLTRKAQCWEWLALAYIAERRFEEDAVRMYRTGLGGPRVASLMFTNVSRVYAYLHRARRRFGLSGLADLRRF